jgi:hypothetical protein
MTQKIQSRDSWLLAGLFFVTLSTLMLEVLDTRLLSVLTWYHLSFLAVSLAMLGMAAGAVLVFVGGDLFAAERSAASLPGWALALALASTLCHLGNLIVPIPAVQGGSPVVVIALTITTVLLSVPFVLSGVVVTLALTRSGGAIGRLYAADLLGAALGCLVVVWVLDRADLTSTVFAASAFAALGSWCFARRIGRLGLTSAGVVLVLLAAVAVNIGERPPVGIFYPKSRGLWLNTEAIDYSAWNSHSNVIVRKPQASTAFYWGASAGAPDTEVAIAWAAIDGDAGTALTEWDGRRESLDWVQYDVTALPHQLRQGRAAIIGVGGGRDVLTALWAGSRPVVGIEINEGLLKAHATKYRDFTRIADHPDVQLVHDEARSFLTKSRGQFDVIQMSLIDTWAATGAGAFTLSENGLYTREGWRVFLSALTPGGMFSVSRWFDPNSASETTRLLALGVAALLDRGVSAPWQHLVLVTRNRVATLMLTTEPFTEADRVLIADLAQRRGLSVLVSPWHGAEAPESRLGQISRALSLAELQTATDDPIFDYRPPTDTRPFFFNMLKPRGFLAAERSTQVGVVSGNQLATFTLIALSVIVAVLVAAIVLWPLARIGRPDLPPVAFGAALWYFAAIGTGFMLVQIPMLQRFSVFLGHPTYTFSIILFLMILSAGAGSYLSDRVVLGSRTAARLPLLIAGGIVAATVLLQPVVDATVIWSLPGRTAVVALFVAPLAVMMGFCFPLGMRLIGEHSSRISAWMWGVNGAMGVLASVLAVMVSMWVGIHVNLFLAAAIYAGLPIPMRLLARRPVESVGPIGVSVGGR